ncbi:MAG: hypothetical protein ACKVH8_24260, partial [Pirellulales bacterium]
NNRCEVKFIVKAEQAQLESVLAISLTVTAAGITSSFRKNWLYITSKTYRLGIFEVLHTYLNKFRSRATRNLDLGYSLTYRANNSPFINYRNGFVFRAIFRIVRQVDQATWGILCHN